MSDLDRVAELVHRETGVVIDHRQLPSLEGALGRVEPGMTSAEFVARFDQGRDRARLMAALVDEFTIKETYLFRELGELQGIDWAGALRSAHEQGAEGVRVWVSACATGEEAYTIAILATEALGPFGGPVSILATDVSRAALARAQEARYSVRSTRNVPAALRERYFRSDGDELRVADPIRRLVRFRAHNLVSDPVPPLGEVPFDVIACRNVLIYFNLETVARVIDRLEGALRPTGTLILGAADRLTGTASRLAGYGPTVERRRRRRSEPAVPGRMRGKRRPARPAGAPSAPSSPALGGAADAVGSGPRPDLAPRRRAADRIEDALEAADAGDLVTALELAGAVVEADPLDSDAQFVRGLAARGSGDLDLAVNAFRRALYVDPSFGLAAFELGRTYDARGDAPAARRAYEQAVRSLDPSDDRHSAILDYVELSDVAAVCRSRLRSLGRS